jgi:predicted aspartyl protease
MPGKVFSTSLFLRAVLLIVVLCLPVKCLLGASCSVVKHPAPSEADKALLAADYVKAADLYRAGLASHPGDAELTIGLVHSLLHQQKVQEAADAVKTSLALAPNSAALITLRGEVELRQGIPWLAGQTALESDKLDLCNPRNHLLLADLERLSSQYATSRKQLGFAHLLDPEDPEIRGEWIHTLSLKQRIAETEAYLSAPRGDDEEDLRHWRMYLESLKKMEAEPHKACHLVSPTATAEIPFDVLMRDATHIRAFRLEVKLNGRTFRLQIDTGAGGLLVSRSVAQRAGLKAFSQTEMGGIGDKGFMPGYTAYADSIRIGNLEFQDCSIEVIDSRNVVEDVDGLIGMDVFSQFLVTLDYPMRKLLLGPLPPRPGETAVAAPSLNTSNADQDESGVSDEPAKEAGEDKPAAQGTDSGLKAPVAGSSTSDPAQNAAVQKTPSHGPYDRYIAPEMKDYTPVYRVGHNLILPAAINGKEIKLFILDTGAFATTISPQAAREVTKVYSDDRQHVKGISGEVEKVYSADEVTFNFAHLSQKVHGVVAFDTSKISKHVGMEISGFLGANTLNLLTIHIDYRDGLVKFDYDPNRGYRF